MAENKFYLSIGRHQRYGTDTAIQREDMICAYLSGMQLKKCLPKCETVYHSPLARAAVTAHFEALGMECSHILEIEALEESAPAFAIRKFINNLLESAEDNVKYYHFVTHLPVVEKLGLPFLGTGEICLLSAENKEEMLKDNFSLQVIKKPEIPTELWQNLNLTPQNLNAMTADEIYQSLSKSGHTFLPTGKIRLSSD
ncbi:MAG: histidine phosphatase family protein [Alphaproteobacteria bacterium]|nr:histidine phosphatase family protein [Alphaproteobacteria bacterium]